MWFSKIGLWRCVIWYYWFGPRGILQKNKEDGNRIEVIDENGKFKTVKRLVNLNADKKRLWFKDLYKLKDNQIQESYDKLREYGNLTGVSIPTVLDKAMFQNNSITGKGLLIGITMGFGLDIVEIEKN